MRYASIVLLLVLTLDLPAQEMSQSQREAAATSQVTATLPPVGDLVGSSYAFFGDHMRSPLRLHGRAEATS